MVEWTGSRAHLPAGTAWVSVVIIQILLEVVEVRWSSREPAVAPVVPLVAALVLALFTSRRATVCARDSETQELDQGSHGREAQTQRASSAQRCLTHWRTDDHSSSANAFQARADRGRVGRACRDRPRRASYAGRHHPRYRT